MEMKLMQAAGELPQPQLEYASIVRTKESKRMRKSRAGRMCSVAVVAVLIACLALSVYGVGKEKYGLWSGYHSTGYGDVVLLNWQYDCSFPKELFGLEFHSVSTLYGAPEGATHFEALMMPTYTMHSISYGNNVTTEPEDSKVQTGKKITISFGSTKKEVWRYHFSVDEDGFFDFEGVIPESQKVTEHGDVKLYLAATDASRFVQWEDQERKLVFRLWYSGAKTEEEVLKIAKAIIDMHRNDESWSD